MRIKKAIGTNIVKKIIPIIIGLIMIPSNNPKYIHALFNGSKIFDFVRAKIKKIIERHAKIKLTVRRLVK
jgi:hypothetical protein